MAARLQGEGVPERFHPKSFRSVFGFNTNLWATIDPLLRHNVQGLPVGVFPMERPMTEWFIPEFQDWTLGGRQCKQLHKAANDGRWSDEERARVLVAHRCRCGSEHPCEEQEAIADRCAKEGQTPYTD